MFARLGPWCHDHRRRVVVLWIAVLVLGGIAQGAVGSAFRDELDWTLLVIEFRVLAARQSELNARFAELHQRLLDGVAEALRRAARAAGTEPPERLEDVVRSGFAFGTGAALARAAEGDAFTDELAEEVGRAVAVRLLEPEVPVKAGAGSGTT